MEKSQRRSENQYVLNGRMSKSENWKKQLQEELISIDPRVWMIVEKGWVHPTLTGEKGMKLLKPKRLWTPEETAEAKLNSIALLTMVSNLNPMQLLKVPLSKSAKEVWDSLQVVMSNDEQGKPNDGEHQVNQIIRKCIREKKQTRVGKGEDKCGGCGGHGHNLSQCPSVRMRLTLQCCTCRGYGHSSDECREVELAEEIKGCKDETEQIAVSAKLKNVTTASLPQITECHVAYIAEKR